MTLIEILYNLVLQTQTQKRNVTMEKQTKTFIISGLITVVWASLSITLGIPWIVDIAGFTTMIPAILIVSGIAIIPGLAMSYVYGALSFDKREIINNDDVDVPISILVAAFNEESTIIKTLKSITNQIYDGEVEVIICNDGSTDKTAELVSDFIQQTKDSEYDLRLINIENNGGKAMALNRGLSESKYDTIVTVDADTRLHVGSLQSLVNTLINSKYNYQAVAGTVLVENTNTNFWTKLQHWDYMIGMPSVKRSQSAYNGTLVAQGAFSAYTKSSLELIGGWPRTVGEDIVLTWRLLNKSLNVGYDTDAVVFTNVPTTYKDFFNQRKRWSRGLIEAFKDSFSILFKRTYYSPYIWYNLLFPFLDFVLLFIFVPSVVMALFFQFYLIVSVITVLILPLALLLNTIIYYKQKHTMNQNGIDISENWLGLICFVFLFQIVQVPATLSGYFSEFFNLKKTWGTK